MWGNGDFGWGIGIVIWLLVVWAAVLTTVRTIFRNIGGPKRHARSR